jgi:putative phage-type endonuclease
MELEQDKMEAEELINIIDQFNLPPKNEYMFTEKDELELYESACLLIEELVRNNPMAYIQPNFHETIVDEVFEMLIQPFDEIASIVTMEDIHAFMSGDYSYEEKIIEVEQFITTIIDKAMNLFYKHIAPIRSHQNTFIRHAGINIEKMEAHINYLKSVPQPEQRTNEWYAFRYKYLTASNIWKAFISQSTKNQLIYEKCKPLATTEEGSSSSSSQQHGVNTESPMHWGHKYEPVSVALYETMYHTSVSEFGCIPHKSISFLAASPDGINTDKTSGRYGRMLEVKNIVNREINGNPKMEYWIQMQLQLEVCDLKECDFLETRFTEYENEEEFMNDVAAANASEKGTPFLSKDYKQKGIIMYFIKDGQPLYEYYTPSTTSTLETYQQWEEATMLKNESIMWIKNIYWKLDQLSCVLVMRNKLWFDYAKEELYAIWQIIEKERIEGYDHRAPKKRISSSSSGANKKYINDSEIKQTKVCYINVENIEEDNM